MSSFLISVVIIFGLLLLFTAIFGNNAKSAEATTSSTRKVTASLQTEGKEGTPGKDEYFTYVAGVTHHCTKSDIGSSYGVIVPEPSNKYDSKAMAVFTATKHVGYIGRNELSSYRDWSRCNPCPCIVSVYEENGELRARVRVVYPRNAEFVWERLTQQAEQLREKFGEIVAHKDFLEISDPSNK